MRLKNLPSLGPRNINWNLTRSAFEKLYLNQVKTFAISNSKFDKTFRKSVSQQYNLLSSANSHISDLIWRRKRALEKIIKSVGLKIDPGCIPVIMPSQELKEDSVLVHCLRLLGWSKIISKFILSKLYAFTFTKDKSYGIQTLAYERLIRIVPPWQDFLSSLCHTYSSLNKASWVLWLLQKMLRILCKNCRISSFPTLEIRVKILVVR